VVYRVKAGPEYELLGKNKLHDVCMSTPAIAKDYLFFRTAQHLIAVSAKEN